MSVTAEIPDRLSVPTCIGCGAMNVFFTCPDGCHEIRLDLIPAETFDAMLAAGGVLPAAAAAFTEIAEAAAGEPPDGDFEAAYKELQTRARKALHDHPDGFTETPEWVGEVRPRATSWCPVCGGLDAPMECIDVCRWVRAEWVDNDRYLAARAELLPAWQRERRLRALASQIAHVTPRDGQWETGWRALSGA